MLRGFRGARGSHVSIGFSLAPPSDSLTNHAEIKALEPNWISGIADGRSLLGRMLMKGDTWIIDFSKVARLHVGNAGGVEVIVNGQSIGPLGSHGLVRVVELTPDRFRILL